MTKNTNTLLLSAGVIFTYLSLASCSGQSVKGDVVNREGTNARQLQIVDCLLPGQHRRLGAGSYLTPRRPILTTASDCSIRGGEYVEYDRADYKTALVVWMPAAKSGDAKAQNHVGEIFERGLGGEPNYESAFIWYQRSAEQGYAQAQFNLGTLYEQGLGVEKDKLMALNWYRRAWGLQEDHIIYQSAANKAQQKMRSQLEAKLKEKTSKIALLSNQLVSLEEKLQKKETHLNIKDNLREEIVQLKAWISNLEEERDVAQVQVASLPRFREPIAGVTQKIKTTTRARELKAGELEFGKYYALIIGNQNYDRIENLSTPYTDAQRAKEVLQNQYGFHVTVLLDADNTTVMKAVNDLNDVVTEKDNLLIFYAGHGSRLNDGELETGYWLPVNASPPPDDTYWVSNEFVTRHLARLKAKRVLVVADSCYAGLLSSAPGYLFMGDDTEFSMDYVRYKLPKKSRLLLSSGGDFPVLDNAGEGHSVFARAFLDALENKDIHILSAPELFLSVRGLVASKAKAVGVDQVPEFKAIKGAGHEVGDFFFVRQGR